VASGLVAHTVGWDVVWATTDAAVKMTIQTKHTTFDIELLNPEPSDARKYAR